MGGTRIVAIDGPAASGKGTLARRLAKHFGYHYLDTGSLYRAVGMSVLRAGGDPSNETQAVAAAKALDLASVSPAELKSDTAGNAASKVAFIPAVRAVLLEFQRDFAKKAPGAVLDGRDIGTVVCPDAPAKIFVTASLEVRVQRRIAELRAGGESVNEQGVWDDMKARDARDSDRSVSPLKPADDAYILDTSKMDADQAFETAKAYIATKKSR